MGDVYKDVYTTPSGDPSRYLRAARTDRPDDIARERESRALFSRIALAVNL